MKKNDNFHVENWSMELCIIVMGVADIFQLLMPEMDSVFVKHNLFSLFNSRPN